MTRGDDANGPEERFGPPDEHLRETLEREHGEVPPESPSEPAEEATPAEGERDKRKQDKEQEGRE
jgi:hypothetical protein